MKKISLTAIAAICFMLTVVSSGLCADVAKIGVINFQKILDSSSAGKMIQKQMGEKSNEIGKQLIGEKNSIIEMEKTYERERLVLSSEKKDEKEREIRIRKNDFIKMEKRETATFKQLQAELLGKFQKEVVVIVEEIGKKEGYLVILEKKQSAVVYFPDSIDITDLVIEKYNKKTASAKK